MLSVITCQTNGHTITIGQKAPTTSGDKVAYSGFPEISKYDNSSNNFRVIPKYNGDVPPAMQKSIQAACDVWGAIISASNPVTIDFEYCDSLLQGNIIESQIGYKTVNNIVQPYTLISAYGIEKFSLLSDETDTKIRINDGVEWDYNLDSSVGDKPNLCFYVLRALAQTFGFSTTICEKSLRNKTFPGFFIAKSYSQFDNLVFDSTGKRLNSIPNSGSRESTELNAFVRPSDGVNVYVLKEDAAHKLYTPTPFIYGQSLAMLDNTASLMHYNPATGSKMYSVDDVTLEVLSEIGWEFNAITPTLSIEPQGSQNDKNFSAYETITFTASSEEGNTIDNLRWIYEIANADGMYAQISQSSDQTFTILPLPSVDQYSLNNDGLIDGRIVLNATVNGREVSAVYDIQLTVTPKIISAEIIEVKKSADGHGYSLTSKINHLGSDYLTVVLEQEYDSGLRYQTITTPGTAFVTFDNISGLVYIWIDIEAINHYGSDAYTIELDDDFIINNVK